MSEEVPVSRLLRVWESDQWRFAIKAPHHNGPMASILIAMASDGLHPCKLPKVTLFCTRHAHPDSSCPRQVVTSHVATKTSKSPGSPTQLKAASCRTHVSVLFLEAFLTKTVWLEYFAHTSSKPKRAMRQSGANSPSGMAFQTFSFTVSQAVGDTSVLE